MYDTNHIMQNNRKNLHLLLFFFSYGIIHLQNNMQCFPVFVFAAQVL